MRSPSGPPIHPPTLLGACSMLAALLGLLLLGALTTGHPLLGGFPSFFLALTLVTLGALYLAALPRNPGPPPTAPAHTGYLLWMFWIFAAVSLVTVAVELSSTPRLWPLLVPPLAAMFLAHLATRAHRRPAPAEPRRHPPNASQNFGTAALIAAQLSYLLFYLLATEHPLQVRPGSTLVLFTLVALLVVFVFQAAEPALSPRFNSFAKPPRATSVFVWLAWPMALIAFLPGFVTLVERQQAASFWPLALFPVAALVFAFLSTHARFQERARQRRETEAR